MSNNWTGMARQILSNSDLSPLLRPYVRPSSAEYLGMFSFGVVVGATLGVLLAPRSGRETRERLGERMHEMRESYEEGRSSTLSQHQ